MAYYKYKKNNQWEHQGAAHIMTSRRRVMISLDPKLDDGPPGRDWVDLTWN